LNLAEAIKVNTKKHGKNMANQENSDPNMPDKQSKPGDELKISVNRNPRMITAAKPHSLQVTKHIRAW
jgi:hypothetical protein